ncbi:MAG: hypothetical protein JSS91_08380 [Bacteroidetes bacterium]|nr:hypothetical protein [Bacteroidota bacterium]
MKTLLKFSLAAILFFSLIDLKLSIDGIEIQLKSISAQQNNSVWTDKADLSKNDIPEVLPEKFRYLKLDYVSMRGMLRTAPFELSERAFNSPLVIELPHPDGGMSKFYVTEYSMMEPGLAEEFPEIKTYNVKGIDDPYAVGKIDVTSAGFHGMILTVNGDYFIDPVRIGNPENYISFYKSDYKRIQLFECLVNEISDNTELINSQNNVMTGQQLRNYRLACAATGEYTAYHGGTVPLGQAAIVTAVNRVNQIYERDLSVRMTLVANNNLLVYTNAATDPYTNNNGSTMLGQNQTNINSVIGSANYDIGHVFSTGGGGVAYLSCVCTSNKARGVTGSSAPIGDPFWIDYVAHEMGHQFGGNHTFNSVTSSCGGGNRNGSTAYEPGSGTTIQAYAGICGADNLQPNSDALFHTASYSEMIAFTQSGSGNNCPQITNTGNTPPTVNVPAGGFTIPISTPFELTGSATDNETPGSLTYCWEEYDLGPAGSPNSPSGNAPIFRSFLPVTSPTRTFPKLSDLLNNTSTIGEILPTYTRNLTFRLTVRDNSAGGGGVNFNTVAFNVSNTSGPFTVTQPNTSVTWSSGSQAVTWNVANTTSAPVSCSSVDILLSTDGGITFPTTLLSGTPNDGSQTVTIPNLSTTSARIKVKSVGNVFFDISNTNFTITGGPVPLPCTDFTTGTFPPPGFSLEFSGTNYWSRETESAYGNISGSAKFDFYNASNNEVQSVVSDNFDPALAGTYLTFDEAYAPYTNASFGPDTLQVEASSNSGGSYTVLATLIGRVDGTGELNTAPPNASPFSPANSEWASKIYSLPVGTNKIRLKAKSGWGNNLYLDNVCVQTLADPSTSNFIGCTPQGFYRGTPDIFSGIPDTVRIFLRRLDFPNVIADSAKVYLDDFTGSDPVFSNALSGTYYIQLIHRNSIETWSKSGGQSFTRGSIFNFDFLGVNNAYNNNQFQVNAAQDFWGMFGGDCTQDGLVDISDLALIDNDAGNFASGYVISDVNGDDFTDLSDYALADNNAFNIVTVQAPPGASPSPSPANDTPVLKTEAERNKYMLSLKNKNEKVRSEKENKFNISELNEVLKQRSERDKLRTAPVRKNKEVRINSQKIIKRYQKVK